MDEIVQLQRRWEYQLAETRQLLRLLMRLNIFDVEHEDFGGLIQSGFNLICLPEFWDTVHFSNFKGAATEILVKADRHKAGKTKKDERH